MCYRIHNFSKMQIRSSVGLILVVDQVISYHLFTRYLYCIPNYSRTQFWQSAGQSNSAPFFLMILHTKYISTYILCTYYVQSRSAHWAEANKKVPKIPTDFKIIFIQQSFKSILDSKNTPIGVLKWIKVWNMQV